MSGGFINGIEYAGKAFTAHTAISYPGTLVNINSVDGEVIVGVEGTLPDGYVHMSSNSMATGSPVATADAYVAVKGLVPGTTVEFPVVANNIEINIGDKVESAAGGCVDGSDAGAGSAVIGTALEHVAVAATTGRYVKVWVNARMI
jgi:hypothetical protein